MKTYEEITSGEEFKEKLRTLNENLKQSLEAKGFAPVIIGNLFYDHVEKYGIPFYVSPLNEECEQKRRRFFSAAQKSNNMFEIGLNGGHSAFLALMANPDIVVTSNDLAEQFIVHPEIYTLEAAKTLKEFFGDRFNFIKGDCLVEVPKFVSSNYDNKDLELDILHIDGAKDTYKQDFLNLLPLLKKSALVIFDDWQQGGVRNQAKALMREGYLSKEDEFPEMNLRKYRLANEILRYRA